MAVVPLPLSLAAWGTLDFPEIFKHEVAELGVSRLPLQAGVTVGSYAVASPLTVMLLGASEEGGNLFIRAGIFFKSVIAGCSCADDPSPVGELNEYCVLSFELTRSDDLAKVSISSN